MRLVAAALLAVVPAMGSHAAERRLSVTDFDRVRVIGSANVVVKKGVAVSAFATGTPEALDDMVVEVIDRELIVQPRARVASTWSGDAGPPARVRVSVPRLTAIRVSGSASVSVDELSGSSVAMAVTGSGQLGVRMVKADRATLGLTGSGTITSAGTVRVLVAASRGSGRIDAAALKASDLTLTAATSGEVILSADRSATVTSSGSGSVNILGRPACTASNTGSGSIACGRDANKAQP